VISPRKKKPIVEFVFQFYSRANLDLRDENKLTSVSTALNWEGARFDGCITFPRPISYPCVFLTLCLAVDYTNKFDTCRSGGLTVALCLREEPAATT
jgi:hypothetical protein